MIVCGLKLSHDASVAIMDDWRLVASVEIEKLGNNARYSEMGSLSVVTAVLDSFGLSVSDIDQFVIDGWHGNERDLGTVDVRSDLGVPLKLKVASYNEGSVRGNSLARLEVPNGLDLGGKSISYSSFMHSTTHIISAYCTSNFFRQKQSSYILVWDGGQYPRLYFYDFESGSLSNLGSIFCFLGTIYGIMGHYFGPYKRSPEQLEVERRECTISGYFGGFSIAGKLMSYIALGNLKPELIEIMEELYESEFTATNTFEHIFMQALAKRVDQSVYSDADVLASIHAFIEGLLVRGLTRRLDSRLSRNLCFAGGSALNIKWNSAIRDSGLVDEIWVPPFPNDSGNGIGAACCELLARNVRGEMHWSVFSGPMIRTGSIPSSWIAEPCTVLQLAQLLAAVNEPVVVLNGRAELGPRALGNRSILAPATDPGMKALLNTIKGREHFRPVAPICLEDEGPRYFDPGTRDPYMLFNHKIRPEVASKIPAVSHLDGTARLQTVSRMDNAFIFELLTEYGKLSGVPILCNTSANFNGRGFFPDVESAIEWGGVDRIFSDGVLYKLRRIN